jgi:cytoskeletal protein CcmA (bactofilin family)
MMVAVGAVSGSGAPAAAAPPSSATAYAVFATSGVEIGAKGRVDGDVGCLFAEVSLGRGTRATGAAAAPAITLKRGARASGGYFCGTIAGTEDACSTLPNPLISGPPIVLAEPGNLNVSASRRAEVTSPLPPGTYGTLTVGTAASVPLAGGTYDFAAIEIRSRGRVECLAACDVRVQRDVRLAQAVRFGAVDGLDPASVTLQVGGLDSKTAVSVKSRARVQGTIYAPSGDVVVGAGARISGAVVGLTVSIGPRARLTGPSATP